MVQIYAAKNPDVTQPHKNLPEQFTVPELIRAVYRDTPDDNKSIVVGYVRKGGQMVLFSGNQEKIQVNLCPTDKLILFSNH